MKILISAQSVPGTDVSTSSMAPDASSPGVCGQSLSCCVGGFPGGLGRPTCSLAGWAPCLGLPGLWEELLGHPSDYMRL